MSDTTRTLNDSISKADLLKIGVGLEDRDYDPSWDRGYVRINHPEANNGNKQRTAWEGPLDDAAFLPYYCPAGWRRFAVKMPNWLDESFWEKSSNMYHGLEPQVVHNIVREGFMPSLCQHEGKAVYLTPSVRYAAHPRYSRIQVWRGRYYQVILQVRVLHAKLTAFKEAVKRGGVSYEEWKRDREVPPTPETMNVKEDTRIDDNHDNALMEFLFMSESNVRAKDGIVITGVLVRCLDTTPVELPENRWFQEWEGKEILLTRYTCKKG